MWAPAAYRMRMALCRPSGSSHTVFQNTPGRRSTHGTSAVVTRRLVAGSLLARRPPPGPAAVVARSLGAASLISRSPDQVRVHPALAPGGFQSFAHHLAEGLHRMRAHQPTAIDEEGRRSGPPERDAPVQVLLHFRLEALAVQASRERLAAHAQLLRVLEQALPAQRRLPHEEEVVVFPETPRLARAARRPGGRPRAVVEVEREVLEDQAHLTREL